MRLHESPSCHQGGGRCRLPYPAAESFGSSELLARVRKAAPDQRSLGRAAFFSQVEVPDRVIRRAPMALHEAANLFHVHASPRFRQHPTWMLSKAACFQALIAVFPAASRIARRRPVGCRAAVSPITSPSERCCGRRFRGLRQSRYALPIERSDPGACGFPWFISSPRGSLGWCAIPSKGRTIYRVVGGRFCWRADG